MVHSKRQIRDYGVAVGSVFIALILMLLLDSWLSLSKSPFLLFFSAVMVTAWYGGLKPGLVATVLAGGSANFFLDSPNLGFNFDLASGGRLSLFVLQGILFSVLCESLRSAKQRAEVNLQRFRESEQRFKLALSNPYITVFQQDRNLRYEWIYNAQHPDPIESLIGKTDYELVSPQEVRALADIKQKVLETGIANRQEVCLTVEGKKQYFDLLIEPVWAENDLPEGIACAAINITDRKAVEAELRRSEAKFRRLVEANIFGVAIGDFSGGMSYANDALLTMIGYTREELNAGQIHWDALTPPDQIYLDWQAGEELRQRGVTTPFQKEYIHKDGHRVPILIGGALFDEPYTDQEQIICFYLDLTPLKQAERALQEVLQRLNFHVENTPLAVIEWDRELRISRWSAAAERIFGWTAEEVLGKRLTDWQFVFEADKALVADVSQRIFNGNEPQLVSSNRNYTKQGAIVYCEWYNSTLTDESGKMTSVLSLVLDVTERKQVEEALRQSEQRFRIAQELSLDAFTVLQAIRDEAGRIIDFEWSYVNPKAAEILQHPVQSLVGQRLLQVLPGNKVNSELFDRYVQVVETGNPHDIEIAYESDGIVGWFRNMAVKLEDGVAISFYDISDRKRTEEALRNSEQRFRTALDNFPDSIALLDPNLRFLFVNSIGLQVYGKSLAEMVGRTNTELWAFEVTDYYMPLLHRAVETRMIQTQEFTIPMPDGSLLEAIMTYVPLLDEAGEIYQILSITQDICERKQYERERERLLQRERTAREQAEAANRIKDEFLAVLSHELRSPLNPILGWATLLRTQKLEALVIDRALETIERNAKLQTQLIEDLLDVSRILRGKLALNVTQVDLKSTIEAALETVRLSADAKAIQISLDFASPVEAIAGDSGRLQQVIWNLLSNAVKFTSVGGHVTVQLEQRGREDDSLLIASYAQITVTDTGKGIAAEFLPHVFDYFRQADSTTTRKFGGLGLGLAIARHIVELHGGTIAAESPGEGQGATFTVRLPILKAVAGIEGDESFEARTPSQGNPHSLLGVSVLVVDDEADMRELAKTILQRAGASVQTASSATEALEVMATTQPDVLLSDVGMPDVDGYTLMAQIRSNSAFQDVVAIALTAYAGETDRQQALTAGFQQHLAKPINPTQLIEAIETLVKNRPCGN